MKKLLIFSAGLLIAINCFSQIKYEKFRGYGWQTLVFRVSAAQAEQFIKWDSIPLNDFTGKEPLTEFKTGAWMEDSLPTGNYILVSANGMYAEAKFVCISKLSVLSINNKHRLQLEVRDSNGLPLNAANVFINNKEIFYNNSSGTFWANKIKQEEIFVKVYTPGDTLYTTLEQKDDDVKPLSQQRRQNWRYSKLHRILNWVPYQIKKLFSSRYRRPTRIGAQGYIIFNQPKYKPLDTVKFKGYVLNKRGKQYKKDIDVYLNYYSNGKTVNQLVCTLSPASPGAYYSQFVLADTVPMDVTCRLLFKTAKQKEIIQNYFKTEDCVLDEIGSYSFKADKEIYFKKDSLHFSASAKDANGLNVMDAKATLLLTTKEIKGFYKDTVFVPDTLYNKEIPLLTNGDTRFAIAAADLPKADITINAKLIFKNSNNELQEETTTVEYKYLSREIVVIQDADSLKAVYVEDGIEKEATGEFSFNDEDEKPIHFPATIKIEPTAEDYWFYLNEKDSSIKISKNFDVEDNYRISFSRISNRDTLGFVLYNPNKIPVYYTVLNGSNIIATGRQNDISVPWQKIMTDEKQSYKVRWQYYWAGKEHSQVENIGLLYKLLNIKINGSPTVFPGQKDSLQIDVTDYKGIPAPDVNLTAVSYNNQFNKDIRVKEPPYIAKYKGKKFLQYHGFENDEDNFSFTKNYLLGRNKAWVNKLHLDTMSFYKLLFPVNEVQDEATPISNMLPQISVNMVKQGVPQEIYLLYINRQLVYYNGVTDKMKNAFEVFPLNVQLGIRLRDKYVEIDSIYMQPNYKHDLSFDLDHLPPHSKITTVTNYLNYVEMNLLEQSIWQMQNDYKNNYAYLWQRSKLVHLLDNREHTAGPFSRDSINFFSPGYFDTKFNFEPGYQYNLSKQVLRLEKKGLFPLRKENYVLPLVKYGNIIAGDTVIAAPEIFYPAAEKRIYLKTNYEYEFSPYNALKPGCGGIQFTKPKDSLFVYFILQPEDTTNKRIILTGSYYYAAIKNVPAGIYTLLMVTNKYFTAQKEKIEIKPGYITCVKMDSAIFSAGNELLSKIGETFIEKPIAKVDITEDKSEDTYTDRSMFIAAGGTTVTGKIIDKKGKLSIQGVTIKLKGYRAATASDNNGNFTFTNLRPGGYVLQFYSVGYESQEVSINAEANGMVKLEIGLKVSEQNLNEVVVSVGYGPLKKREITGSAMSIREELTGFLQGKVAGVQVRYEYDSRYDSTRKLLRGATALSRANAPLYVIDGILYDELPKNINLNEAGEVTVLKDAAATSLYGARASNGVIIITTKTKTFRQQFKDYALWQPNFFTDKNGQAKIAIQYPDNITGWKTFVVGMDKKNRMGKSFILTQAYKPIVAELSVPQFLIEGDSASIIGKSKNYTNDKYNISTTFSLNEKTIVTNEKELLPNNADITATTITSNTADTIKASFTLQSSTGFKDGEERKIPVFKKGTEESDGHFWVLQNDSAVTFNANNNLQQLNIYAQNNTLDLLLEEVENLRRYPYYCMEQIASKLTGLALEKKIKEQLAKPFSYQKEMDKLLQKIQKAQLFDGGWSWWENGKANFYISNYIATALLRFRQEPLVETNIRNAFLYLQNQLPFLKQPELLAALYTLSNGKHEMNYAEWLNHIHFDSLSQHQQWQYVSIKQQQKMNYENELKKLLDKKTETMLGGTHWGSNNYSWYSNDIATTVLAYKVLSNEPAHKQTCLSIIQYFLERRRNGYWANTVESASILDAILPAILQQQNNFNEPASVQISGDSSFTITHFPYKRKCSAAIKNISISKTGGGMVYFTAYQNFFNNTPQPVEDKFIISTVFKQNNQNTAVIKPGEKTTMLVTVNALKDAEFVQIEIPIPAGCTYGTKTNNNWQVYREHLKNKVLLFAESLTKGVHSFEIELEPRYSGSFTLNPAKASLMYFPIFYGRNEMRKLTIEK